jgi:hypothetical protein
MREGALAGGLQVGASALLGSSSTPQLRHDQSASLEEGLGAWPDHQGARHVAPAESAVPPSAALPSTPKVADSGQHRRAGSCPAAVKVPSPSTSAGGVAPTRPRARRYRQVARRRGQTGPRLATAAT